ncbi:MAG: uracil-DNA glycosylase [Candidatus Vogelbacteria bacterium CG10_big_fil_rev_8_21_14_0_10_45_14]|uniref:Uracil-DNA glycosylase n=1 Tax=Candidatus Vogelbacteria bacterium CG10_big_fil_rev_8_21_14_0_10_45_14 TaxID=1975042 RepID=A0A2H0RJS3_9BACT|nr:MAG: uracil-DNA glycosylase [Candidatus Vogelbacteria bacterium CG10_big_fil_rev_8_21_14_0_10_45_14]
MDNINIESSWKEVLKGEFGKPYWKELTSFVRDEYLSATVYPPPRFLFRAFELTPFDAVKVVILGQDPYHGKGQAHGFCFSVPEGVPCPPSLRNIYKEIEADLGVSVKSTQSGNVEHWARQGVLLLNATLTVRAGVAGSHQNKGWEDFTDATVRALSERKEGLIFLLWGNYAKKKGAHIDKEKHLVLEASHPSPLGAHKGFFGCKHFSKTNEYLEAHGKKSIGWIL